MSELIDRQAAIDGKISIQLANGVEIYSDEAVPVEYLKNLPTIQPEERTEKRMETHACNLISRQEAIDALKHNQDIYSHNFHDDPIDKYTTAIIATDIDTLVKLPTIQPEPAIPLSWIEKHIEWLKSFDNEFANLEAAHISVMVKKWRNEQDE